MNLNFIKDLWYVLVFIFFIFCISFRILNWIFKNMHLVIAVVSHIHKMFIFSSWCLASEENKLLESIHNGSELRSWVSYSVSSYVFSLSFSFSFSVSSLSFCLPLTYPTHRFTHVSLVKFLCWVLLIYKHVFRLHKNFSSKI